MREHDQQLGLARRDRERRAGQAQRGRVGAERANAQHASRHAPLAPAHAPDDPRSVRDGLEHGLLPSGSTSGPRATRRARRATRGETRPARVRRRPPAHSGAVPPPGAGRCSARAGPSRGARDRARAASPRPARPPSRARACGGARCGRSTERSITPRIAPDAGSRTGAAAHVQPCRSRLKCSAEKICTACSSASAVPTAFVPTAASLQSAPGLKCGPSAASSIRGCPSIHSSVPSASLIATR